MERAPDYFVKVNVGALVSDPTIRKDIRRNGANVTLVRIVLDQMVSGLDEPIAMLDIEAVAEANCLSTAEFVRCLNLLVSIGWIKLDENPELAVEQDKPISFTNVKFWQEWSDSILARKRMSKFRHSDKVDDGSDKKDNAPTTQGTLVLIPEPPKTPKARQKPVYDKRVRLNVETWKVEGVEPEDRSQWAAMCPGCDVDATIQLFVEYAQTHPQWLQDRLATGAWKAAINTWFRNTNKFDSRDSGRGKGKAARPIPAGHDQYGNEYGAITWARSRGLLNSDGSLKNDN